ncbi:MAG: hypothetical protein AAGI23_12480 [Bacteroidota bacterium]
MQTREDLQLELLTLKAQMDTIVHKRLKKVAVRWLLGALLYYFFWDVTWMRYLFWFALGAEVVLTIFTAAFYWRTKPQMERIEGMLDEADESLDNSMVE